jgi:hypothetical protein
MEHHAIQSTLQPQGIRATALAWGVSYRTVTRWLEHGLPFFQQAAGCKVLIRPGDVEAFLKRRQHSGANLEELVEQTLTELGGVAVQQ